MKRLTEIVLFHGIRIPVIVDDLNQVAFGCTLIQ